MLTIHLPWPPIILSPNSRPHWAALATAKKRFRARCHLEARAQGATRLQAASLALRLRFVPPDRRHRDQDNLVAAMKSGLDGLADALGVNDSIFRLQPEISSDTAPGGRVVVEVSAP